VFQICLPMPFIFILRNLDDFKYKLQYSLMYTYWCKVWGKWEIPGNYWKPQATGKFYELKIYLGVLSQLTIVVSFSRLASSLSNQIEILLRILFVPVAKKRLQETLKLQIKPFFWKVLKNIACILANFVVIQSSTVWFVRKAVYS